MWPTKRQTLHPQPLSHILFLRPTLIIVVNRKWVIHKWHIFFIWILFQESTINHLFLNSILFRNYKLFGILNDTFLRLFLNHLVSYPNKSSKTAIDKYTILVEKKPMINRHTQDLSLKSIPFSYNTFTRQWCFIITRKTKQSYVCSFVEKTTKFPFFSSPFLFSIDAVCEVFD